MNQGQQPPQVPNQGQQPPQIQAAALQQLGGLQAPPPVLFARTPARFQLNLLLNFAEQRDVEIYNRGCTPLTGDPYDGKNLHPFLVKVGEKAAQFNWTPMLTFGARNLIVNYGEITREEVRQAAEAYHYANDRRAQDSDMLFHCLSGSLATVVHTKLANETGKYTFQVGGENIQDGTTYLKAIIDATYTYSLSNTAMARAALSSLDKYMESLGDSNITQFCQYTKEKLQELEAANETTQDLTVNFFKGLAKAKDKVFRRWVQGPRDEWVARRYVIDADCSNFMEEADNYYKDMVTLGEWLQLDEDQATIVALKAQLAKRPAGKENDPNGTNRKKGGQKKGDAKKGSKKDEWECKKRAPKGNDAKTKSVYNKREKKNVTYHWCTHHQLWTMHSEAECTKEKEKGVKAEGEANKTKGKAMEKVSKQKLTMRVLQTLAELPSDSESCSSP